MQARHETTQHALVGWGSHVPFPDTSRDTFAVQLSDIVSVSVYKERGVRHPLWRATLQDDTSCFLLVSTMTAAERKAVRRLQPSRNGAAR